MLPTFIQQIIGAIVRAVVMWAAGYLAARGVTVSDDQTMQAVAWLTPLVATLAWSIWQKYRGRQKLVQALAQAGTTEARIEANVKSAVVQTPSVLTPKTDVPS